MYLPVIWTGVQQELSTALETEQPDRLQLHQECNVVARSRKFSVDLSGAISAALPKRARTFVFFSRYLLDVEVSMLDQVPQPWLICHSVAGWLKMPNPLPPPLKQVLKTEPPLLCQMDLLPQSPVLQYLFVA